MSEQVKSWSKLVVKSVDDEQRIIRGIATTPSTDRVGDIVESKGARFSLPFPLLSQHNHDYPIGEVKSAKVTDDGIEIEAQIPKGSDLFYVERAWNQIKSGLIKGLSIGFRPFSAEPIKGGGVRYKEYEIFELSAVTVPANADCSIALIKSIDQGSHKSLDSGDAVSGDNPDLMTHPARELVQKAQRVLTRGKTDA